MSWFKKFEPVMPSPEEALPGRGHALETPGHHFVSGVSLLPPFPPGLQKILLGMGCFWGAERLFWGLQGVYVTAVGYAGGYTPNPTYEEVSTGRTGHAEVVLVVFDPTILSSDQIFSIFWESHNPLSGMRQGNDVGTQYRSSLWPDGSDLVAKAIESRDAYQRRLTAAGISGKITTEMGGMPCFYYAEPYHQQYLAKNPQGYCGLNGLGVALEGSPEA